MGGSPRVALFGAMLGVGLALTGLGLWLRLAELAWLGLALLALLAWLGSSMILP